MLLYAWIGKTIKIKNWVFLSQYHNIVPEGLHPVGHGGCCHCDGYPTHQICSRAKHLKLPLACGIIWWSFCGRKYVVMQFITNPLWVLSTCLYNSHVVWIHTVIFLSCTMSSGDPSLFYRPFQEIWLLFYFKLSTCVRRYFRLSALFLQRFGNTANAKS